MTKAEALYKYYTQEIDSKYNGHPPFEIIYQAMDEYAKQQAISFVKWAIDNGKIIGDNYGEAYMPLEEEDVYNQFIEQQNKP